MDHAVSAGVELKVLGDNMVPLYEEHQARLDYGYSLADWQVLDPDEKALTIAMRRIHLALENIQAEAQIREAKRNAKTRR